MKIGIIGGGASGVIAAIKAKDKGADVVIFEKEDRIHAAIYCKGEDREAIREYISSTLVPSPFNT